MVKKISIIILISVVCFLPSAALAGGLSSNWGEVVIKDVEPGNEYDLNEICGVPFNITNNFDEEVTLNLKVLIPREEELKPGYEPIPNEEWIQIPESVLIKPGEKEIIPVYLKISNDESLKGRNFHVWVWSYTSGQAVGVGLKSRILIKVAN